jgi:mannose-6-phosphate isomerase-like protein (cupin superfamily)
MIKKETAEHYRWGHGCEGWHLLKHADLSVIQERMPPNTSEANHYHAKSRQLFYILSGVATMGMPNETEILEAGEAIEISPGTAHQLHNRSDTDLEFLVISQPPSHGDKVCLEPNSSEETR